MKKNWSLVSFLCWKFSEFCCYCSFYFIQDENCHEKIYSSKIIKITLSILSKFSCFFNVFPLFLLSMGEDWKFTTKTNNFFFLETFQFFLYSSNCCLKLKVISNNPLVILDPKIVIVAGNPSNFLGLVQSWSNITCKMGYKLNSLLAIWRKEEKYGKNWNLVFREVQMFCNFENRKEIIFLENFQFSGT